MKVGIFGGCTIFEVGTVSDVVLFFDCVKAFSERDADGLRWELITDRLYKRYVRVEDIAETAGLMRRVREDFARLPLSQVEWLQEGKVLSAIDMSSPNLAAAFSKYFEAFEHCSESARLFLEGFGEYQAIRVMRSDVTWFVWEKMRPLAQYEALDGPPFWIRPQS